MADLHEALKALSPTQWSDVPLDNLAEYMQDAFTNGELICNSVPPPANGEPFHTAKPQHKRPNAVKSHKEMQVSTARPAACHTDHEALRSHWGKPYKFGKDKNPLDVALYKMAGHDRHGAWFARRSIHEGVGFERFRKAMVREFPHTLTVEGGPGAGAVRGLAGDSRLEKEKVEGVGQLEVYQLSGQMPKPVTPREFLQLLMTTEGGLSDKSAAEVEGGSRHVPRSYMIVSKPLQRPDCPERAGFVRGQYESVELIREIPLHRKHAVQSVSNLSDSPAEDPEKLNAGGENEGLDDPELNPVEWIMVTRSDPGGGIPRFLVERGTPDAMLGDVPKFIDWACHIDELFDPNEDLQKQNLAGTAGDEATPAAALPNGLETAQAQLESDPVQRAASAPPKNQQEQSGVLSGISQTFESYAPAAVTNSLHDYLHPTHAPVPSEPLSDDSSDSSSLNSFMSANEMHRLSIASGGQTQDAEKASLASAASSGELDQNPDSKSLNSHDKEVQKLIREREKLDRKLAKKRAEEESKLNKAKEKEASGESKQREKHETALQKAEERHRKEIEKLEQKKAREAEKAEAKRRKKDDQAKLSLVSRERDEFRRQMESHKRENGLLMERMEELQRENTALAGRLGKLSPDVLKEVLEDVGRKRTGSVKSEVGRGSMESVDSKGS